MDYEKLFDDIAADICSDKNLKKAAPVDLVKNGPDKNQKTQKSCGPGKKDQQNKSRSINGYSKKGCKLGRPTKADNTRIEIVKACKRDKNADSFLLVENSPPDVLENSDLYIECLNETIETVKNNFFAENPDLIKKHPSIWFRYLCNTIKQNSPKMDTTNYDLLSRIWDIYSNLCLQVGINRTIENFQIFAGLNWNTIDRLKKGSSPDCIEIAKKIYDCCRSDIVGGLSSSFGSSPNQMFIAKAVYGLTENTVVTHVSKSENEISINDLPLFIADHDTEN